MAIFIGLVLSLGVALLARWVGFDRSRAFYPTILMVIASYYVLFAVMGGSFRNVIVESVVMAGFAVAAIAGFRSSAWIVVVALVAHGVFDGVRSQFMDNPGAPVWWPPFCLAYDLGAAACLAWLIRSRGHRAFEER